MTVASCRAPVAFTAGLSAWGLSLALSALPQRADAATQRKAVAAAPAGPDALIQAIENADKLPTLGPGARGPAVVRAQVLLDREWFTVGEIDGRYAVNTQRAVRNFQQVRGLKPTGVVDGATWEQLQGSGAAPLVRYAVTGADLRGPFEPIPKDIMERAKLKRLGYTTPLEGLAERFHASPKLLQDLNAGRPFGAGAEIVVPAVLGTKPTRKAVSIVVLKKDKRMLVLDGEGVAVASFPVSMGGRNDPLPLGQLKIRNEVDDPVFSYDPKLMWDAKKHHAKVDVPPGPNNPVGNVWLGLSKPHWGIHGTPEPSMVGRTESHGCVHLTNWDAKRLSTLSTAGFTVDVRE